MNQDHYLADLKKQLLCFVTNFCVIDNGKVLYNTNNIYDLKEGEIQVPVNDLTIKECLDIAYKIDKCFSVWEKVRDATKQTVQVITMIMRNYEKLESINNTNNMTKELAAIKDQLQTTNDIVNLFTDIDKNRTNLEEQVNQVNKRLDKLETNMDQILKLLQKS